MEGSESGKRPRRRAARKASGADGSPRKCTVVLSAKLDMKLSAYATMRRMGRSAVVAEALEEKIGSMVVSFRGAREEGEGVETPRLVREESEGEGAAA